MPNERDALGRRNPRMIPSRNCDACKTSFAPKQRGRRFCGWLCYQRSKDDPVAFAIGFWNRVEKTDGCWLWMGATKFGQAGRDYGEVSRNGKMASAHRVALELGLGRPIPRATHVLHACDTPRCVRPSHLRLGTHRENMEDRSQKNRQARGEQIGAAKLTAGLVREIRFLAKAGFNLGAIGRAYGINPSVASRAARGITWSHL